MFSVNITDGEISALLNNCKENVVRVLISDGLLDKDKAEQWLSDHVVVVYKPSWFGRVWKKIWGEDKDNEFVFSVAQLSKTYQEPSFPAKPEPPPIKIVKEENQVQKRKAKKK